jgi:hypothetical protein
MTIPVTYYALELIFSNTLYKKPNKNIKKVKDKKKL